MIAVLTLILAVVWPLFTALFVREVLHLRRLWQAWRAGAEHAASIAVLLIDLGERDESLSAARAIFVELRDGRLP